MFEKGRCEVSVVKLLAFPFFLFFSFLCYQDRKSQRGPGKQRSRTKSRNARAYETARICVW
jgi:hypothetical protein